MSLVPSIAVGSAVDADRIFHAEAPRGTGLGDRVEIEVGKDRTEITGAELRAALLSTVHTGPWVLGPIGAGRYALQLDPEGRSSAIAHLDAQQAGNVKYWLYRRGEDSSVQLTRWVRVGFTSQADLLEQTGVATGSKSTAALERELTDIAGEGLPQALELRQLRSESSSVSVKAPSLGWLDIPPGALKVNPDRIPIHAVDDLGEWPGEVA